MSARREKGKKLFRVFLSFAQQDKANAEKLRNLLAHYLDARVFTADSLSVGENWRKRLKDEISRTDLYIILLSPHGFQSSYAMQELGAAWALKKPVLSISTDPQLVNKLPVEISDVQYVDLQEFDDSKAIERIFEPYLNTLNAKTAKGLLKSGVTSKEREVA